VVRGTTQEQNLTFWSSIKQATVTTNAIARKILVTTNAIARKIERQQRPIILWIAANNSSLTSSQICMKAVPKRSHWHSYLNGSGDNLDALDLEII
jgi:hypothetical protein